ncbi:MAG: 30S ribosomal protein S6 [Gemmatimonadales bacterium]|nr:30S ribosomal protein S6 [Gemmatimonadales bacterium]
MARINPYEVVYIFDSSLEDQQITDRLTRFHTLIATEGAEAPTLNHWGRRTLAYPIRKKETGYYVVANFSANPEKLPEFERAVKLDEGVIRFLVVLNDKDYTPSRQPGEGAKDGEDDE